MTQIDIEHILLIEEIRQLLEQAEQVGNVRASDLAEIAETYELTELEQDAVLRELDQRSIEIVEQPPHSETVVALTSPVETTTDALQLFLREAGRHQLLTAAQEVELAKRIERGDMVAKEREIETELGQVAWAPRVNVSARTGRHMEKLVPAIETALAGWETRVPTGRLNAFLGELV